MSHRGVALQWLLCELFRPAKVTGSIYSYYFTEFQAHSNGMASQNPQPPTKQTDNEITVDPQTR